MKLLRTTVIALSALSLFATSSALAGEAPKKGEDQTFIYDADTLKTKLLEPIPSLTGLRRPKPKMLIDIRQDFIDKILDSSRSI